MIWKVAWRNVWRSRTRTAVVIGAVILAIWALVFIIGFVRGMVYGYIQKAVQYETSHIQVHNPDFLEENTINFYLDKSQAILDTISRQPNVVAVSPRIVVNAMISTAKGANGILLKGVDPEAESRLTKLDQRLKDGEFFSSNGRNQIVISTSLAEKLNVGVRKKVVVTFQDLHSELTTAAFRVVGLFDTNNKNVDDRIALVRTGDLRELSALPAGKFHEIAINMTNTDVIPQTVQVLKSAFPESTTRTFEEISPDLGLFKSQVQLNMIIMTTIIMLALIFGIVNTMLMAVLERTKELGMLMAIGMNKVRVFWMVVIETIYVSVIGAPIGMLLGWLTVTYLHQTGIDLSMWSTGLSEFGMATLVRPVLEGDAYIFIAGAITLTALIASIYPSIKAISLKPVEALRKV